MNLARNTKADLIEMINELHRDLDDAQQSNKSLSTLLEESNSKCEELKDALKSRDLSLNEALQSLEKVNEQNWEQKSDYLSRIERITLERNMAIEKRKKIEDELLKLSGNTAQDICEYYGDGVKFLNGGCTSKVSPFHSFVAIDVKQVNLKNESTIDTIFAYVLEESENVLKVVLVWGTIPVNKNKVFLLDRKFVRDVETDAIGKIEIFVDKILSIFNRKRD